MLELKASAVELLEVMLEDTHVDTPKLARVSEYFFEMCRPARFTTLLIMCIHTIMTLCMYLNIVYTSSATVAYLLLGYVLCVFRYIKFRDQLAFSSITHYVCLFYMQNVLKSLDIDAVHDTLALFHEMQSAEGIVSL